MSLLTADLIVLRVGEDWGRGATYPAKCCQLAFHEKLAETETVLLTCHVDKFTFTNSQLSLPFLLFAQQQLSASVSSDFLALYKCCIISFACCVITQKRTLSFAAVSFLFFIQREISAVSRPIAAKLCHMIGNGSNF